ncbi:MAG: zf-HC2 domain-containing protein [Planctomycetota bacterium]
MSRANEELLNPADEQCASVRELMLAVEERDLTELEAQRVEQHVEGCVACVRLLEGRHEQDRLVRNHAVPQPTAAEWAQVEAGIRDELGLPDFGRGGDAADDEAPRPMVVPMPAPPGTTGWGRSLLPVAAAILLTALVVHNLSKPQDDPGTGSSVAVTDLPVVEVDDLLDDQTSEIFLGDEEDEGVVVFMTTDEE